MVPIMVYIHHTCYCMNVPVGILGCSSVSRQKRLILNRMGRLERHGHPEARLSVIERTVKSISVTPSYRGIPSY
jgi:hypothetical protein